MGNLTMSTKEVNRLSVLDKLKNGELSQMGAAKILQITDRQVRNQLTRYKKEGAKGLLHRNRGKQSKLKWNAKEKLFVLELLASRYKGFGPTFATEKLREEYNIVISKETLRAAMIRENLWKPKQKKPKHRIRRPRKMYLGEMIQLDGSEHDWFEGRAPSCTLLVFIDDATSTIFWLEFAKSESTESLMKTTQKYIEQYGRPISFYLDHHSVYKVNLNNSDGDKLSQFGRAMKELGINLIYAGSPQAKGRVERCNKTLQDRLIAEMRLQNISSVEAANKWVHKYIQDHNRRFAKQALCHENVHRDINHYKLDKIFCIKEERILQNDFVISYQSRLFQLKKEQTAVVRPKEKITIRKGFDGSISLSIRNIELNFYEIIERLKRIVHPKEVTNHVWKPAPSHPWREAIRTKKSCSKMEVI